MIRPVVPSDTPVLLKVVEGSGLFAPEELDPIRDLLDEYHATNAADGHILTCELGGVLVAITYYVPKPFTDRVWELLMIAVNKSHQRQGLGTEMLVAVEQAVRDANGRLLLIETSDLPTFAPTRHFYHKNGFTEVAHIPDFFADGNGKVSFIRRV